MVSVFSADQSTRQRAHAKRMQRAERRQKQPAKLVEKWKEWLAELDRVGIAAQQPTLWGDVSGESADTFAP